MIVRNVYRTALKDGKTVGYYFNDIPQNVTENYISAAVPSDNVSASKELFKRGFRFADRSLMMEFPIKDLSSPMRCGKKYSLSVTKDWSPEELYVIANDSFDSDHRFVFDNDKTVKEQLLCGFIKDLKEQHLWATLMYHDDSLIGFNLWRINNGNGRIMLGAVSAAHKGTGIAVPLYSHTLDAMARNGADQLREFISSSNISSLNLHLLLTRFLQNRGGVIR